ncbi:MAG: 50S ribosomal protein L18 [Verrucomicrobiota bacterium]|jgi:large subunit ribosomal protein L18
MSIDRKTTRRRIHARIRKKLSGSAERPRLAVHFSNRNICVQVIDDTKGVTLASVNTTEENLPSKASVETATAAGKLIAERAKAASISAVVFDRGGHIYHGKVKALADAAREAGLQF